MHQEAGQLFLILADALADAICGLPVDYPSGLVRESQYIAT
jgi:hypothetical protein